MNSVTIPVETLITGAIVAYGILHLGFGLITHYHSVLEVRSWNKIKEDSNKSERIGAFPVVMLFCARMLWGLPWFVVKSIVAPVRAKWHWSPDDINTI